MSKDSPAKIALARFLETLRDARIKSVWANCPSVRSTDILAALASPDRDNTPRAPQLLEVAAHAQTLGERLIADAEAMRESAVSAFPTPGPLGSAQSCIETTTSN